MFLLLVLRTQTIERKVETGFVVRQAVLAQETVQEKSLRFISLLLRALPMAGLLVAWPVVAVYVIIPRNKGKKWIDLVTIGQRAHGAHCSWIDRVAGYSFLFLAFLLSLLSVAFQARFWC